MALLIMGKYNYSYKLNLCSNKFVDILPVLAIPGKHKGLRLFGKTAYIVSSYQPDPSNV